MFQFLIIFFFILLFSSVFSIPLLIISLLVILSWKEYFSFLPFFFQALMFYPFSLHGSHMLDFMRLSGHGLQQSCFFSLFSRTENSSLTVLSQNDSGIQTAAGVKQGEHTFITRKSWAGQEKRNGAKTNHCLLRHQVLVVSAGILHIWWMHPCYGRSFSAWQQAIWSIKMGTGSCVLETSAAVKYRSFMAQGSLIGTPRS